MEVSKINFGKKNRSVSNFRWLQQQPSQVTELHLNFKRKTADRVLIRWFWNFFVLLALSVIFCFGHFLQNIFRFYKTRWSQRVRIKFPF